MANQASFPISPEMRSLAEQSVEQARKAMDGLMEAARGAVASLEGQAATTTANVADMQRKALGFAENNMTASFELARQLASAKDPAEMAKLHADFVRAQI